MNRFLIIIMFTSVFGVGEAGAIFLLISPSASANGFGQSGVGNPSPDIYSSFFNPAHSELPVGFNFKYSNMKKTSWLPNLADDIRLGNDVKRVSYSFLLNNFNLQFCLTRSKINLDLGEMVLTDEVGNSLGVFNSNMFSNSNTLSVGIKSRKDIPFYFSFGVTDKEVIQNLANATSETNLYDWGFKFIIDNYKIGSYNKYLGLSYSIGYSKSNIGDSIWFIDKDQADPAPTTARLGMSYGIKLNIFNDLSIGFRSINSWEDLLLERHSYVDSDGNITGEVLPHSNDMFGDILDDQADIIKAGSEVNILDIYYIRDGSYLDEEGKVDISTKGYGINYVKLASFMIKALKQTGFDDNFLSRANTFLSFIDIQRNYSGYSGDQGHPLDNIKFDEITFSINYQF